MIWYFLITAVVSFIAGYLVAHNNPNLSAVNKLIADGDAVIKSTADGITSVQKVIKGKS